MKSIFLLASILFFAACGRSDHSDKKGRPSKPFTVVPRKTCEILKKKPLSIGYTEVHPDPQMKNLRMIGTVGRYGVDGDMGKILRVLRYQNIADAVEARYPWIPKGTILAMMAQESGGADLLPNGNNDGGIGSIHMQGATASEFGLDTYKDCDDMVCKKHGKELRMLIEKKKAGKKELVDYDDRFNPILNLDAVGRMLTYHRCSTQLKGLTPYQTAICRYSGSYNYRKYSRGVEKYRKLLTDTKFLERIELTFNKLNQRLTIDGKKADFKRYIEICQAQNEDYGLKQYLKLGEFTF